MQRKHLHVILYLPTQSLLNTLLPLSFLLLAFPSQKQERTEAEAEQEQQRKNEREGRRRVRNQLLQQPADSKNSVFPLLEPGGTYHRFPISSISLKGNSDLLIEIDGSGTLLIARFLFSQMRNSRTHCEEQQMYGDGKPRDKNILHILVEETFKPS